MLTLREMQEMVDVAKPSAFKHVPSVKAIIESGAEVVEKVNTSDGGCLTVYDNGIVVCTHGIRTTRMVLHKIKGDFIYKFKDQDNVRKILISEDELMELPWEAAAFLFMEKRVLHSQNNSKTYKNHICVGLNPIEAFVGPDDYADDVHEYMIKQKEREKVRNILWYALDRIKPFQREILIECFYNNKSKSEIADSNGTSWENVRKAYKRGLANMKVIIEELQAEMEDSEREDNEDTL